MKTHMGIEMEDRSKKMKTQIKIKGKEKYRETLKDCKIDAFQKFADCTFCFEQSSLKTGP